MTSDLINSGASGPLGVDVSTAVSKDQWQAFARQKGTEFAVARCYRNVSGGAVDKECPSTIKAAWAAGIKAVDVYHFPVLPSTKSPEQQVDESLTALHDVKFGRYWLDVEGDHWPPAAEALDFINRFLKAIAAAGRQPGIYTGISGWKTITSDSSDCAARPLWWSSHGKAFAAFGGWAAPQMVQLRYDLQLKGGKNGSVGYDLDQMWLPGGSNADAANT
jgi:hypothetical protein